MSNEGAWEGNVLTIDGSANGNAILPIQDGAIVVGDFAHTVFFGPKIMLQPCFGPSCSGHRRIFVAKLRSEVIDGQTKLEWEWATQAGSSSGSSSAYGVAQSMGAYFITGSFASGDQNLNDPVRFGPTTLYARSVKTDFEAGDVFVAKLNTTGGWLWATPAGGNSRDRGSGIVCPKFANGGCVVVGHVGGWMDVTSADNAPWPAFFGADQFMPQGADDVFVAGISGSGAWQWVLQGNGTGEDRAYGVTEVGEWGGAGSGEPGEVAVVGYFGGQIDSELHTGSSSSRLAKPTITFGAKTHTGAGSENSKDPYSKDIFVAGVTCADGFKKSGVAWAW
jgi:hypothetical protein